MINALFAPDHCTNIIQVIDAIDREITKATAVLDCLLFAIEFTRKEAELDKSTIHQVLNVISDNLENLSILQHYLEELH